MSNSASVMRIAELEKKKMKVGWKQWSPQKHKYLIVKFAVAFLFVGLALRLLFFRSTVISPSIETPFPEKAVASTPPVHSQFPIEIDQPPPAVQAPFNRDQMPLTGIKKKSLGLF